MIEISEQTNYDLRKYLALSHEDGGKCHIYGDDGELQCNNLFRHGRCIDFLKEPFEKLLDTIYWERMIEYAEEIKKQNDNKLPKS